MIEVLDDSMVDAIASAVAARLAVPLEHQLWDGDDCARYFRVDTRHFQQRIAPLPTFPNAARLPTLKGKMHPRYYAGEVVEWARRNR